jgi:hypothetical protein
MKRPLVSCLGWRPPHTIPEGRARKRPGGATTRTDEFRAIRDHRGLPRRGVCRWLHGAHRSAWVYAGGACEARRARVPCGCAPGGAGTLWQVRRVQEQRREKDEAMTTNRAQHKVALS